MAWPRIRVTERQMLLTMLGATVLTVAVAFLWATFSPGHARRKTQSERYRVRWMRADSGASQADARYIIASYVEPSIMSLPDARGFSKTAWRRGQPPAQSDYEPERTPSFLAPPSGMPAPVLVAVKPLETLLEEQVQPLDYEADVEEDANGLSAITNSIVQIGGGLVGRRLAQQPILPLAPAGVSARQPRVFIAVAAEGRVRYAVLDRPSGNEALDTEAVELARKLRFEMISSPDPLALTWGTVRFLWAVAPAP